VTKTDAALAVAAILASYLIGGIPIGLLIAQSRGVDLRKIGSGNIGATNVFRALGAKLGLLSFALDVLKGFLPPLLAAKALGVTGWALGAAGLATVVGHCFSPYLRFAGGKGVATSLGIALALYWPAGAFPFALWIVITALTRYVSLGSVIALTSAPVLAAVMGAPGPLVAAMGCATVLSVTRHVGNLERLLKGTESRFGSKGAAPAREGGSS
jgi:glycerol-3-phosphate acyltransferase PlsY